MRPRLIAVATLILVSGAIAACGSSSKTSPSAAKQSSSGPKASSQPVALISTKKHGKLGTVLAYGPKKLTVYLFEADKPGTSSCMGACAAVWPPVTGAPKAGPGANASAFGTITRPDGTKQVTYHGHPLYTYVRDKDDGDTYGEGVKAFGASWYALAPSGKKVDLS